jgi:uncharacterized protein
VTTPPDLAIGRRSLPMADVTIDDDFWSPRRETVRTGTLPQQERQLRSGGQFEALRLGWKPGDPNEPHIFWESDVAKWIEAASYSLATTPDPALEAAVDEAIELLAGAQQEDGYLNVYFTVVRPGERFTDLRDTHELYCAGHLIEAGVAHFQATGKTSLLDIVRRFADLIDREFGPGGSAEGGYDGHEEVELALVKLFRVTGERRYLELSKRLVDARGTQPFYFDLEREKRGTEGYFSFAFPERPKQVQRFREYTQSHLPVREQTEAVGHSVRAMYLYTAMADLALEYGDDELRRACERLWENLTEKKLYVTGGLGSDPSIEGFGPDYHLPGIGGYAETCAAIGLVFWSQRMALLTGEGRYADVMERALYNAALSGASAEGTHYFYDNPLASDGSVSRHEWFGVACCPPNFARLLSSLEYYAYAEGADEAVVNLFVAGSASFSLDAGTVRLDVDTAYPRSGSVSIRVAPGEASPFTIAVRVPGWAAGGATARLNGEAVDLASAAADGYLRVERDWKEGDVLSLDLPLQPERIWANPAVTDDLGRVALRRGPLVYCLEGVDHPVPVAALSLPRNSGFDTEPDEDLGIEAILSDGFADRAPAGDQSLYRSSPPEQQPTRLRAVPYFAWANRGQSTMEVWIRETSA